MALIFERIRTEGIAGLSYLIGDDSSGTAAVIDPRTDVAIYLQLARQHRLAITHALETHIHADFVSGSRELAAQSGSARIYASVENGAEYGFEVEGVRGGDRFEFGGAVLTARHTPGHTPEHVSYEVAERCCSQPWGVFTGDALFVSSAGRPDLLGKDADKLASQLYDTLFGYFAELADGVIIYPSHGAGSPCGADIGDRLESTIGYEKRCNIYYRKSVRSEFVEYALSTVPPEPAYYSRMKKVNAAGPEVLGHLPVVPALSPAAFREAAAQRDALIIDTRDTLAFGGGHIAGALNIGATPMLTTWAGWLLDPDRPLLLVLEDESAVEQVVALFVRSGYTKFGGYLAGGMIAWDNSAGELAHLRQMTVQEFAIHREDLQVLDVRSPAEWRNGHVPGSRHIFVPELRERAGELRKDQPVVTYCASGYRASIAASILQRAGFTDVRTLPGSWMAGKKAGLEAGIDRDGH